VVRYTGSTGEAAGAADANAELIFDALRDFRFTVLKAGLDGDLADRMVLSLSLQGRNPAVLDGQAFNFNISIDSALMDLLNLRAAGQQEIDAVVRSVTGAGE
jgi:hypothetical protein